MAVRLQTLLRDYKLDADRPFRLFHYRRERYCGTPAPDFHHAVHFGVMLDGEMEFHYPQQRVLRLVRGDVFLTAPWEAHCDRGLDKCVDAVNFAVLPEHLGGIGMESGFEWLGPFLVPVRQRISKLPGPLRKSLLKLADGARTLVTMGEEVCSVPAWLKLHEMVAVLVEGTADIPRSGPAGAGQFEIRRILPAIALVHARLERPVTLESAARACSLGRSRFSKLFQNSMGISFGRFAVRARLAAAIRAVIHTREPFKSIAPEFGFFDASHLCRAFQEHYGLSPQEIRSHGNIREPGL